MRRAATFVVVALSTAVGSLWWLHEGDLAEAVQPVVAEWDAELLARNAGLMQAQAEEADVDEAEARLDDHAGEPIE